ncbi:MAG: hypothetical protein K9N49_10445 [Candidatus Marinimicrobia bacterium]|nr:hypothetical protein [Candidatus Neomarinimicrobiota bacterium]
MHKILTIILICALVGLALPAAAQQAQRGGFMGFIAGCCFGVRAAGDYNAGKDIHWREWCRLIPYAGIVFAVWDGIDGSSGKTTADYAKEYGAHFF